MYEYSFVFINPDDGSIEHQRWLAGSVATLAEKGFRVLFVESTFIIMERFSEPKWQMEGCSEIQPDAEMSND